MAKKTNDEPVEATVPPNRNRMRTVGWIAGGVLALGATFAAGAAVGNVMDGPRGGHSEASQHGPSGEHGAHGETGQSDIRGGHGPMDANGDRGHHPRGEKHGEFRMDAPTDGLTRDGSVPSEPETAP
jgi:hypothetical protein